MIEIKLTDIMEIQTCADCGVPIGYDVGPPDGWQLEDGRTVCQKCCVDDAKRIVKNTIKFMKCTTARGGEGESTKSQGHPEGSQAGCQGRP